EFVLPEQAGSLLQIVVGAYAEPAAERVECSHQEVGKLVAGPRGIEVHGRGTEEDLAEMHVQPFAAELEVVAAAHPRCRIVQLKVVVGEDHAARPAAERKKAADRDVGSASFGVKR